MSKRFTLNKLSRDKLVTFISPRRHWLLAFCELWFLYREQNLLKKECSVAIAEVTKEVSCHSFKIHRL